jgi:hypothetical protein
MAFQQVQPHWKRGSVTGLVLYTERLWNSPAGIVWKWCDIATDHFGDHCRRYIVKGNKIRSGELLGGISTTMLRSGPHQCTGIISSSANHTLFVIRGTTGPIVATRSKRLRVRAGNGYPEARHASVNGQQAYNFFDMAWRATAHQQRALRRAANPF